VQQQQYQFTEFTGLDQERRRLYKQSVYKASSIFGESAALTRYPEVSSLTSLLGHPAVGFAARPGATCQALDQALLCPFSVRCG